MKHSTFFRLTLRTLTILVLGCSLLQAQAPNDPPKKGKKKKKGVEAVSPISPNPGIDPKTQEKIDYLFLEANTQNLEGNAKEAINLFLEVLKLDPRHHASMYNIASISLEINNLDQADEFAKRALALNPENYWYYMVAAKSANARHDLEGEIKILQDCVKKFPEEEDPRFDLAQAFIGKNKFSEAIVQYDELEKRHGFNEEMIFRKFQLYMAMKQPEKGAVELDKLIAADPTNFQYFQAKMDVLRQNGKEDEAIATLEAFVKNNPSDGNALLTLADFYRTKGDFTKSDAYLFQAFRSPGMDLENKMRIISNLMGMTNQNPTVLPRLHTLSDLLSEAHPGTKEALGIKGDLFLIENQEDSARKYYKEVLKIEASNHRIWEEVLRIDLNRQDWPTLQKDAEASLELFPSDPMFCYFLGQGARWNKDPDQAIFAFEKVKKLGVGNIPLIEDACVNLGDLFQQKGNFEQSDANFEEALKLNPNNSLALNNYAYFLSLRKVRLDEAEGMSKKALDKEPKNPSYLDTYGWILFQQEKFSEAEKWIGKAMELDPSAEVMEHYGDVQKGLGNLQKAEEYWKKAQEKGAKFDLSEKMKPQP